jgi:hypothetical protein
MLKQRHFLNVIKYLGNELQIRIVAAGTHDAFNAIQTGNRMRKKKSAFGSGSQQKRRRIGTGRGPSPRRAYEHSLERKPEQKRAPSRGMHR